MPTSRYWTQEETAFLDEHHGLMSIESLTQQLNERFRRGLPPRTEQAIYSKMNELGMTSRCRDGYVTLKQASELTGVAYSALREHFGRDSRIKRKIKSCCTGMGGRVLVSLDSLEELKALWPEPPAGYISAKEADAMVGFCGKSFTTASRMGKIPHFKTMTSYYVPKELVLIVQAYLRRTGRLKTPWAQMVAEYNSLHPKAA